MTRLIKLAGRLFRGDFGGAEASIADHDDNSMRIDLELEDREEARGNSQQRYVLGGSCRW